MAYVEPVDFVAGTPLTKAQLDAIQNNIRALKDPPTEDYTANEGADYSTTSGSFVDVDGTNFSLTATTVGGDVMVGFFGSFKNSSSFHIFLEVDVDGSPYAGDDGITASVAGTSNSAEGLGFVVLIRGLSAASHTFKLQWKVGGGTATLHAGAGTANGDTHPQFWVKEL
jgi:hypothetical protein